jgi:hypothetical protein
MSQACAVCSPVSWGFERNGDVSSIEVGDYWGARKSRFEDSPYRWCKLWVLSHRRRGGQDRGPTFTNDIVRSSCKLQIAAGEKPEGKEFREKRARHCLAELEIWKASRGECNFRE